MLGSDKIATKMLIRREQMSAFQKAFKLRFEDRVLAHVSDIFAKDFEKLGERGARERISESISMASHYGFSTERNLVFYVDLTFVFGADYDRRLSWANSVLTDAAVADEDEKRRRLMNAACDHPQDAAAVVPPRAR
jgi:hypothetical protein